MSTRITTYKCCPKRHWIVCRLDNLTHALGLRINWLCDRHEFNITGGDNS